MHRGCFVWTPTPPLAGRRTPRPGPVRVCVCSSFLAGSGGAASRARSAAPHLFIWPICLSPLLGPLRAGVAPVLVLCLPLPPPFCFCFVVFFFRLSVLFCLAPPLSLAFLGFRPRVPLALALCVVCFVGLALLGSLCALAFFVLPGRGPLSGGYPPPPPVLLLVPRCLALVFFFSFFSSRPRPPLSPAFCVFRPRVPWALALVCVCCAWLSALCVFFFCLPPPGPSCALPVLCLPVDRWLFPGVCCPPPVSFCVWRLSSFPLGAFVFFFLLFCAPPLSLAFSRLRPLVPWALALCFVCFSRPPAAWLSVRSRLVCVSRFAVGCSLVVAAPPPLLCLAVFVAPARCLGFFVFFSFL